MSSRHPSATRTEEYPPPHGAAAAGREVLLGAFPQLIAVVPPAASEVVGREWLAQAGVRDSKVSSEHLRLSRSGGRLHVEDMGSRNGTWIDGEPVPAKERVPLNDGAVLRFGNTLLVYRAEFVGALTPAAPVGELVGPWGLGDLRARLEALSRRRERNVLLEGATGTGKELAAAAVKEAIGRGKKPWAAINVAAIAAGVFEAQLFGWERGAHSGAAREGRGTVRESEGGSVFLDEIGELPLELQAKLLRLLENRQVQPVGGSPVTVDVAVIAATNRPLAEAVARGVFRRDLHARFTERITLPALADRPEDVYAILQALAARHGVELDETRAEVAAVERLLLDEWPANVRDLDRVAAAFAAGRHLGVALVERVLGPRSASCELTREAAERMVKDSGGNERAAAGRFGVSRGKLRRALGKGGGGGRAT